MHVYNSQQHWKGYMLGVGGVDKYITTIFLEISWYNYIPTDTTQMADLQNHLNTMFWRSTSEKAVGVWHQTSSATT